MKNSYMQTKIVCTIGPASNSEAVLTQLIHAGMNVARLNFSHNTHEDHLETIQLIKKVREKLHAPVAILLDTKGPEIRLRTFQDGFAMLENGNEFTLTTREVVGNSRICTISYADLPRQLEIGTNILIDDGKIRLEVMETGDTDIRCKILSGGRVSNRKSINIPKVHLDLPYLSPADEADLIFGIENDVDFIAASFVRCKEDVVTLRKFVNYHGGHKIRIISKIENIEGVENIDEILKASDGIMVARGDMGVEVDFEKLPGIQKKFIRKCYQSGKMVITATQMLESMIHSTTPTRAEITDVANAVFDGTSAVMLSGETAVGDHPVHVVKVMAKIARQAERDAFEMGVYKGLQHENDYTSTTNAICDAACKAAYDLHASAIIAVTKSGETARRVSKFRPDIPIVAATPDEKTFHQLALSWGVCPVLALPQTDTDTLFRHAIDCAKQIDVVDTGDKVVITGGVPLNLPGYTNILKVQTV